VFRGARVAQWVEVLTLGFSSGLDLGVIASSPASAPCSAWNLLKTFSLSLPPSPSPPLLCVHSLSHKYINLKKNKILFKEVFWLNLYIAVWDDRDVNLAFREITVLWGQGKLHMTTSENRAAWDMSYKVGINKILWKNKKKSLNWNEVRESIMEEIWLC